MWVDAHTLATLVVKLESKNVKLGEVYRAARMVYR
jgi:hypothetical protein